MRGGILLGLASALLAAGLVGEAVAQAQSWPDRPVKLILPYPPAGDRPHRPALGRQAGARPSASNS